MELEKKLYFYGGMAGAWVPMFAFMVIMITAAMTGHISLTVFAAGAFAAVCIGFLLCKNKKEFDNAVIGGVGDHMLATMTVAFIMAGVLSQLLRQSGLIQGLIWLSSSLNLNANFLPVITFITCVLISTACGTTGGTCAAVTPIMLPLAVSFGCNPGLIVGAIMSGSIFGDNLAPISDTTIASALTQETDVSSVVRTRLPFSLISGVCASIFYIYFGFKTLNADAVLTDIDASKAPALVLLILPVIMAILMIKGVGLVSTMLVCNMLGVALNLALGLIPFSTMISAEGPVVAGISGMSGLILFCIMLFAVLELTKRSGAFNNLIDAILKRCDTPMKAELASVCITAVGMFAIAASTANIIMVGPFVRQLTKKFKIARTRGANIIDGFSTALGGVLPYNSSYLLCMSLALASGAVAETFSFREVLPYCFHSYGLMILYTGSVLTGIGRKFEAADGETETAGA